MFDDDNPILCRLRALCLSFPGAEEYVSHGRPNFRTTKNFRPVPASRNSRLASKVSSTSSRTISDPATTARSRTR